MVIVGVLVMVAVCVTVGVSLGTAVPATNGTKRMASAANSNPLADTSWVLFPN